MSGSNRIQPSAKTASDNRNWLHLQQAKQCTREQVAVTGFGPSGKTTNNNDWLRPQQAIKKQKNEQLQCSEQWCNVPRNDQ